MLRVLSSLFSRKSSYKSIGVASGVSSGVSSRFSRDKRGNVAILFGLLGPTMCVMMGVVVDYANASRTKTRAQTALDSALLSAVHLKNRPESEIRANAEAMFRANYGDAQDLQLTITNTNGQLGMSVSLITPQLMGKLFGETPMTVNAVGGSEKIEGNIEVTLALDTTMSMKDDMGTLKTSAKRLAQVLHQRSLTPVKLGVVPFTSVVNPGRSALPDSSLDIAGQNWQQGSHFSGHWINGKYPDVSHLSSYSGCGYFWDPNAYQSTGSASNKDQSYLDNLSRRFAALLGVTQAHAMPPTDEPLLRGATTTAGEFVPQDFGWSYWCPNTQAPYEFLYNPSSGGGNYSYYDLFDRVGVTWKGCVEARAEPYDVTDDAATSANFATQWWPAFWPDDDDKNNWIPNGHNAPQGWGTPADSGIFKYNRTAVKTIQETPPNTRGPNKSCPEPILPLTGSRSTFDTYVDGLSHWDSGGTVISEGVGWGWRVLSPSLPFAEGAPYHANNRKILVVMSDGQNEMMSASNTWSSQYTAYGSMYWNGGRWPVWSYEGTRAFFDARTIAACDNAKAAGIEIYMVLFRQADFQARDLFQRCASDQTHMIEADNPAQLEGAFEKIATSVLSKVRLTR
jgi:Flp pilus assembly protein TadG